MKWALVVNNSNKTQMVCSMPFGLKASSALLNGKYLIGSVRFIMGKRVLAYRSYDPVDFGLDFDIAVDNPCWLTYLRKAAWLLPAQCLANWIINRLRSATEVVYWR